MFTLWAISCAPLYLGTDLTHMDPVDLAIITNRNLIAIDQAGIPAAPLDIQQLRRKPQQAWITINPDGSAILALFNLGSETSPVKVSWHELDALRNTHFAAHPPTLTDLVTNQAVPTPTDEINFTLDGHASRVLRLTPPTRR
jgi:alpha-galactosidase